MVSQKKILVIDDDPDFLDYVQIILVANGYLVRTAATASAGLGFMREEPPDLVIVDVMMSYALDGWTVSREMNADPLLRSIPIIMVSAIIREEDDPLLPTGPSGRLDAFMSKPLRPAALLAKVAQLLNTP